MDRSPRWDDPRPHGCIRDPPLWCARPNVLGRKRDKYPSSSRSSVTKSYPASVREGMLRKTRSRTCSITGCERPSHARGWCRMHHKRWLNHGTFDPGSQGHSVQPDVGGCWIWTRGRNKGYARFKIKNTPIIGHRFSYELCLGPVPTGMHLDHRCRVRSCVNPAHLDPVTIAENNRRSQAWLSQTSPQTKAAPASDARAAVMEPRTAPGTEA